MNSSRNFKFHRFSDIPFNNRSLEMSKYFSKTNNENTFRNNIYNNLETNIENPQNKSLTAEQLKFLKLQQFNNNNNNISIETKNNKYNLEEQNKPFPIKEIINSDFEKLLKIRGINIIKQYIPQMVYENLDNINIDIINKNKLLLYKYQQILQYLFQVEKNMNQFNNILESSQKDMYNSKSNLIDKELKYNRIIDENNNKIFNLEKKIDIYKKILISVNLGTNKPINNNVLDIHDEKFNYYCDVCPDKVFNSYQEVRTHYMNEHKNILKIRERNNKSLNDITINNEDYEKFYFDKQLNSIKEELKYLIYSQDYDKNKNVLKKNDKKILFYNYNQDNKNLSSKNLKTGISEEENNNIDQNEIDIDNFDNRLNEFEKIQKNYNDTLQNNFNNFKNEIFAQLQNLKIQNINNNNINNINNITNINNINNYTQLGINYNDDTINNTTFFKNSVNNNTNNINIKNNIFFNMNNINNDNNNKNENNNINNINKPKIKDFMNTFSERENKLLFTQEFNELSDLCKDYNILKDKNNNDENISNKTEELIGKINNQYNINDNNMTKEEYKQIINDILNNNEKLIKKNHNFFDLLSIDKIKNDIKDIGNKSDNHGHF